jgi:hypothetical protein
MAFININKFVHFKAKGAVSFQLKPVGKRKERNDLAMCRDNSVYQTIFNGTVQQSIRFKIMI